jgi:hypothetical protein
MAGNQLIPLGRINPNQLRQVQTNPQVQRAIQQQLQNRNMQNSGGDNETRAMVKNLSKQVDALASQLERVSRRTAPSTQVRGPNRNAGVSGSLQSAEYGHGGVQYSDEGTFESGAVAAGDTETVGVSGDDLNRIQNATVCTVEAIADTELEANAENYSVTMKINGDPVPAMRNIPLAWMIKTLDDERQVWPVGVYLTASDNPSFEVEARNADSFSAAQDFEFRLEAGGQCD